VESRRVEDVDTVWADDGLTAVLQSTSGSWIGHLRVEQWYHDQALEASHTWVTSWLDPHSEHSTMLSAAIECPALTADDPERRRHLVKLALAAMDHPPRTPAPFATPAPTPKGADEWSRHFDLQGCWEAAFGELIEACKEGRIQALPGPDAGAGLGLRYGQLARPPVANAARHGS
jgi:hypothetical protein